MNKSTSILSANSIELHYWFDDDSHSMDAVIRNSCEREFLAMIKTFSEELNIQIKVDVEAKEEGGIIEWYNFITSSDGVKLYSLGTFVLQIIQIFLTRKSKLDKEEQRLKIELLKIQIENARNEAKQKNIEISDITDKKLIELIDDNIKLKKQRSNFYQKLEKETKVETIEVTIAESKDNIICTEGVQRKDFSLYILESNELDPIDIEDAVIEIISPVLKKGKDKWTGIYNGEKIMFTMHSNEFKTLVQIGDVVFKNGASINCYMQIKKEIDNEGNIRIKSYDVIRVNSHFINDKPVETPEGKRNRQNKEAERMQMKIDFN
ncbi:MAG: hypothetical protein VB011_00170 [Bacteroidales bacterium]|nr:hypothetical protein [Bacteroidales bacterium]